MHQLYIRSRLLRTWLFGSLLALIALVPIGAAADGLQRPFQRIVVFGTSLSDPGNLYQLNGGINVAPPDFGMTGLDLLTAYRMRRMPSAPTTSATAKPGSRNSPGPSA